MEDGLDELPLRKKLPRLKEEALEKTFQAEKVSSTSRDSQGQYAATMEENLEAAWDRSSGQGSLQPSTHEEGKAQAESKCQESIRVRVQLYQRETRFQRMQQAAD